VDITQLAELSAQQGSEGAKPSLPFSNNPEQQNFAKYNEPPFWQNKGLDKGNANTRSQPYTNQNFNNYSQPYTNQNFNNYSQPYTNQNFNNYSQPYTNQNFNNYSQPYTNWSLSNNPVSNFLRGDDKGLDWRWGALGNFLNPVIYANRPYKKYVAENFFLIIKELLVVLGMT
jgi:hypothetical protein